MLGLNRIDGERSPNANLTWKDCTETLRKVEAASGPLGSLQNGISQPCERLLYLPSFVSVKLRVRAASGHYAIKLVDLHEVA